MKQQAIKAAYGEYWAGLSNEQQKYALENEGWIKVTPSQYQMDMFSRLKLNKNTHSVRPKCLTGIRNNNSWTRIESESDLPGNINSLWIRYSDGSIVLGRYNIFQKKFETVYGKCFDGDTVTHYQPIEVPKPPIF